VRGGARRDLTQHLQGDFSRYRGPGASTGSLVTGVPLHQVFDWSLIESNPHTAWRPRGAALQAGSGPNNTAQLVGRPEAAGRPHRSGGCPGAPSARPLPTAPLPRAVGTRAGGGGAPRRPPAHVLVGDALAAAGASARTYPCGRDVGSGTPRRSGRVPAGLLAPPRPRCCGTASHLSTDLLVQPRRARPSPPRRARPSPLPLGDVCADNGARGARAVYARPPPRFVAPWAGGGHGDGMPPRVLPGGATPLPPRGAARICARPTTAAPPVPAAALRWW